MCIGVVLQLMRDVAERVPCNNDRGEGGQLGFITTIEILNNHLPHISSIFPLYLFHFLLSLLDFLYSIPKPTFRERLRFDLLIPNNNHYNSFNKSFYYTIYIIIKYKNMNIKKNGIYIIIYFILLNIFKLNKL